MISSSSRKIDKHAHESHTLRRTHTHLCFCLFHFLSSNESSHQDRHIDFQNDKSLREGKRSYLLNRRNIYIYIIYVYVYIERENFVFLSNSYLISFFSNFFFIFSFSPLISSFSKTQTSRCRKNVFFSVRERNFGRLRERRPKCFLSFNFLLSMEKRNFRDCCKTLSISACGNIS